MDIKTPEDDSDKLEGVEVVGDLYKIQAAWQSWQVLTPEYITDIINRTNDHPWPHAPWLDPLWEKNRG